MIFTNYTTGKSNACEPIKTVMNQKHFMYLMYFNVANTMSCRVIEINVQLSY